MQVSEHESEWDGDILWGTADVEASIMFLLQY